VLARGGREESSAQPTELARAQAPDLLALGCTAAVLTSHMRPSPPPPLNTHALAA
jgi:hypothetical protein